MALYAIEQKWVGIGKETTRGTAVDPTRFIPVAPDAELEYKLNLIEDETVRGIFEKFPPKAGRKEGTGTISGIEVTSDNLGELLNSLLGSVTTTHPGTTAYQHSFKRATGITMPSYTISIHRGINAKQYPLSVIKSVAFSQDADNKLKANATVLYKTEQDYASPATPTWVDPTPFMFYQNTFKIDGNQVMTIKNWSLTIDNGSAGLHLLNNSQDIYDIVSHAKLLVTGSFTGLFEDEIQRNKFLSNTSASLDIISEGAEIETGYKHTLEFIIPEIHYTAYPFTNVDGMLGANVSFNAYYNLTATETIEAKLINTVTGY
jgi:hypothetical protein